MKEYRTGLDISKGQKVSISELCIKNKLFLGDQ
jgi:hypothetical protein